jgi:quercetin dioxygenase-like cupin family protein
MQKVNEFELKYRGGASGVKYMFRGPFIDWGVIKFLPGETLGRHYHAEVEETFYFVRGTPKMIVNGEELRIKPGDAVRLSPQDVHDIINDTPEPADAVFIKHTYKPDDKVNV